MKLHPTISCAMLAAVLLFAGCKEGAQTVEIPESTRVLVSLETGLSSQTNKAGDRFEAITMEPITVDGEIALPAGTTINGTIASLSNGESTENAAYMTLTFDEIVLENSSSTLSAMPITIKAGQTSADDPGTARALKRGDIAMPDPDGVIEIAALGDDIVIERGQPIEVTTLGINIIPVIETASL